MRVAWSPLALSHLLEIREYIARQRPPAAERIAAKIVETVDRLEHYPKIGRPGRVARTRELVVPGTPFLVAYTIIDDQARILAVLHGARQWELPDFD